VRLAFWKPRLRPKQAEETHILTDSVKINMLLEQLRSNHCIIKLSSDEHIGHFFSSAIISINKEDKSFALDELTPDTGNTILAETQHLHFEGHVRGILLDFDATLISTDNSGKFALHHFAIPEGIEYLQRRGNFRAKVTAQSPVTFSTYRKDSQRLIHGTVTNLSVRGIGVTLKYGAKLYRKEVLKGCRLQLPQGERITVDIEIRQSEKLRTGDKTRIGCRFVEIDRTARKKIEKLVRKLERTQIRGRKSRQI
jgi:c-di-GMP-binding flagellar brake protein YcgR